MAAPVLPYSKSTAMTYVCIWDVKTVPDLKTFAAAKGLGSRSDDQLRAAMGYEISSSLYRSSVCLEVLIVRFESNRWVIDSFCSWSHAGHFPVRMIIKRFFDTISDLKAATVTFNGGAILQYRAMREKLSYPRYSIELPICTRKFPIVQRPLAKSKAANASAGNLRCSRYAIRRLRR
jgi:hypothetical protein